MRLSAILLLATLCVACGTSEVDKLINLDRFQWENRLIVVFAEAGDVEAIERLLSAENAAMIDRDLLWFIVANDTVISNYAGELGNELAANLTQQYARPDAEANDVLLIGKDGTVKSRAEALDTLAIFGQIDQMPMRRQEMQEQD